MVLAVALMAALLCAAGALPAQAAKKGGPPELPDAASDHARPGNGVATVPAPPDEAGGAETGAGTEEAAPPPPPDPPANGSPDNGANDVSSGPYDPDPADPGASGVGQPSGNGKSTDNNGNRPCAGCVGNADYKNPPGQLPDGSDHNKGYECDENEGIGKMNPAHSGCAPAESAPPVKPPTVTPPTRTPPVTPPTPPVTPPTQTLNPPTQNPEAPPPTEEEGGQGGGGVQGVEEAPDVPQPPQPPPAIPVTAPIATTSQTLNELPFTGGHALRLGLLGFLALVVGLGLARLLRIRSYA